MARPTTKQYLITREDGFTGPDMWVQFWRGQGLFGLDVMHIERPDWVKRTETGFKQTTGVSLEEYLEYFADTRKFGVKEISPEDARAFKQKVEREQREEEARMHAKRKAAQKAKTEGKAQVPPTVESPEPTAQSVEAAKKEGEQINPPAEGGSAPDLPPHLSGAMNGAGAPDPGPDGGSADPGPDGAAATPATDGGGTGN